MISEEIFETSAKDKEKQEEHKNEYIKEIILFFMSFVHYILWSKYKL